MQLLKEVSAAEPAETAQPFPPPAVQVRGHGGPRWRNTSWGSLIKNLSLSCVLSPRCPPPTSPWNAQLLGHFLQLAPFGRFAELLGQERTFLGATCGASRSRHPLPHPLPLFPKCPHLLLTPPPPGSHLSGCYLWALWCPCELRPRPLGRQAPSWSMVRPVPELLDGTDRTLFTCA